MTAPQLLAALFEHPTKPPTPARISKAQSQAARSGIAWDQLKAAMTTEQRAIVEGQIG